MKKKHIAILSLSVFPSVQQYENNFDITCVYLLLPAWKMESLMIAFTKHLIRQTKRPHPRFRAISM